MDLARFEQTRPGDYLLHMAKSALGRAYKRLALSELAIGDGDVVLDLGCGPGADLSAFATAAGQTGQVVGLDNDAKAVRDAMSRVAGLPGVSVVECDIHALAIPDAAADRVHTDRVLQHAADPAAVLSEARRVLRPGGRAVFAEPDWDTLIIDYPDLAVARAYTRFVSDEVVRNSCIGRQLVRRCVRAGFEVASVTPVTAAYTDVQAADKVLGFWRVTERAVAAGYLTADMATGFLGHLAGQPFFASSTLYVVTVTVR